MPRGRMLNKKISFDEEVAKLSLKTALLYTWCIPNLDVEGRILASFDYLKGNIVPYRKDFSVKVIKKCIEELGQSSLVLLYGNNYKYMQFLGFNKNQNIKKDREAPSEIPTPTPAELQQNSCVTPVKVNISKDKLSKGANAHLTPEKLQSDEEFIQSLKTKEVYRGIDINRELGKIDVWLLTRPQRKKTRRFIVNWLNRIDKPLEPVKKQISKPDPKCDICQGKGRIPDGQQKGAQCLCVK